MAVDRLVSSMGLSVSPRMFLLFMSLCIFYYYLCNQKCYCCLLRFFFQRLLFFLFWVLFLACFQTLHPLLVRIQVHSRSPLRILVFHIFLGWFFFVGSNFFAVQKIVHTVAAVDFFSAGQYMCLVLYFQQLFYRSSAWQKEVFFFLRLKVDFDFKCTSLFL